MEKDNGKGIKVVVPFRYDEEASLRKFYLAIVMHECPFNILEHEYFVQFIKSLRPSFPIKSRMMMSLTVMKKRMAHKEMSMITMA